MALSDAQSWRCEGADSAAGDLVTLVAARTDVPGPADRQPLLARALSVAGCEAPVPVVDCQPRQAPSTPGWTLSYADSGPWLLAAAMPATASKALGADIERNRRRDYGRLEAFLGWRSKSADLAHFYRRWTLAEALFKALGGAHAKATFDALDSAMESKTRGADERQVALDRWRFRAMWPPLASEVTACWLLADSGHR